MRCDAADKNNDIFYNFILMENNLDKTYGQPKWFLLSEIHLLPQ